MERYYQKYSDLLLTMFQNDSTLIDTIASGIYYYHTDHLGSASWIVEGEEPVQYIHYMPYGELWVNQRNSTYDERYKFTGKERDAETGYDFFGARNQTAKDKKSSHSAANFLICHPL